MIQNRREFAAYVLGVTTAIYAILLSLLTMVPQALRGTPEWWFIAAPIVMMLSVIYLARSRSGEVVDVWAAQRTLMHISAQKLPEVPTLTSDAVMYLALVLEEASEAAATIKSVIESGRAPKHQVAVAGLISRLGDATEILGGLALDIRHHLARVPVNMLTQQLSMRQARALLDDATDMAVVVAGFANAAGLPAAEAYKEVQASNMSKAHPVTGMIEKTADGKWIKGVNYEPPNFDAILNHVWADSQSKAAEL